MTGELGGTYYLPYRLHATPEQMRSGYPMTDGFFAMKRHHDPSGRFQDKFSLAYASGPAAAAH